ncbi:uncharacterized protein LOC117190263 [Drosophila miranda]|uniref:uncharacterized protein LOC117190263 n=1 Tax=Drosophila miranda TaxID=7229 RepID=UPI00143F5805|nr:uncharacterized protein LOC117190263 [Drosophila miranda]
MRWKIQKLVLIPKPGKPPGTASSYRPICLIDTAFNTARWSCILKALESFDTPRYLQRMVQSYFERRLLLYDTQAGTEEYEVSAGVPQGSVLGPTMWNAMYDGILRLSLPHGVNMVGFADDVAVLVVAKDLSVVETTCNSGWTWSGSNSHPTKQRQCWRQLLTSVTRSVMLYTAPIWAKALRTASYARGLAATHRLSSIRITSAFRTVSDEAAHVIAGIAPLEFLADERSTYYQETHGRGMDAAAKRQVRMACKQESLRRWQQRWDTTTKGRRRVGKQEARAGQLLPDSAP